MCSWFRLTTLHNMPLEISKIVKECVVAHLLPNTVMAEAPNDRREQKIFCK